MPGLPLLTPDAQKWLCLEYDDMLEANHRRQLQTFENENSNCRKCLACEEWNDTREKSWQPALLFEHRHHKGSSRGYSCREEETFPGWSSYKELKENYWTGTTLGLAEANQAKLKGHKNRNKCRHKETVNGAIWSVGNIRGSKPQQGVKGIILPNTQNNKKKRRIEYTAESLSMTFHSVAWQWRVRMTE